MLALYKNPNHGSSHPTTPVAASLPHPLGLKIRACYRAAMEAAEEKWCLPWCSSCWGVEVSARERAAPEKEEGAGGGFGHGVGGVLVAGLVGGEAAVEHVVEQGGGGAGLAAAAEGLGKGAIGGRVGGEAEAEEAGSSPATSLERARAPTHGGILSHSLSLSPSLSLLALAFLFTSKP
uniref:Uncharacterized protein n=1 Tax=Ananas comosus var. bracteatus TaxID=296719 RepID=A0A6V7QPB0_ANACO|nr:unnamed protein product [Ananas comosus var. bracteatus]